MSNSTAPETTSSVTIEELLNRIVALESKIDELTKPNNPSQREMTDEDARNILIGELKDTKHNEAAKKLNLSYGQIYSCRLQYTFRHIHKELETKGFKNPWKK